jgi:hypothetical protein
MVKVKKDNVEKTVSENVLSDYLRLGWELVKETKESKTLGFTNKENK